MYDFPPNLHIGTSETIKEVTVSKLLCIKIQSNLKWQENTDFICQKAAKKLWVIRILKIFGLETDNLLDIYKKKSDPI